MCQRGETAADARCENHKKEPAVNSQAFNTSQIASVPENKGFWSRDLISTRDLNPAEVEAVLHLAGLMKSLPVEFRGALAGKQMVMFFEKPSLRTRLTFEAGMASLGGTTFFMDQTHERIDAREKLSDIAHNLERWVNAIVLRTFDQQTIEGMAEHACIPVINALSDLEHPCQGLTDCSTLRERCGDVKKICLSYLGDGNNVAHSLLLTCASLGSHIRLATPSGYEPDAQIVADACSIARQTGATIECCRDPYEAVAEADAVYTDTWASMGREHEADERSRIFQPYQVNEDLISAAASHAIFMHCLPAHRGQEITDAVIDSEQSVVFEQAENRLHVQKAILMLLLGGEMSRLQIRSAHA